MAYIVTCNFITYNKIRWICFKMFSCVIPYSNGTTHRHEVTSTIWSKNHHIATTILRHTSIRSNHLTWIFWFPYNSSGYNSFSHKKKILPFFHRFFHAKGTKFRKSSPTKAKVLLLNGGLVEELLTSTSIFTDPFPAIISAPAIEIASR